MFALIESAILVTTLGVVLLIAGVLLGKSVAMVIAIISGTAVLTIVGVCIGKIITEGRK